MLMARPAVALAAFFVSSSSSAPGSRSAVVRAFVRPTTATRTTTRTSKKAVSRSFSSVGGSNSPTKRRFPPFVYSYRNHQRIFSATATTTEEEAMAEDTLNIASNLASVRQRIQAVCNENSIKKDDVRLVAVSKTKPIEILQAAYNEPANQRFFGENYVQELISKVPLLAEDAQWHFIGALQSNKVNPLLQAFVNSDTSTFLNRLTVETVSSEKLANKLNNKAGELIKSSSNTDTDKLNVFVQVNTSAEDSKSGVEPGSETVALCRHVVEKCPFLNLKGLMTIGAPGDVTCFDALGECRSQVATELNLQTSQLELSMGMSGDFEQAIAKGATNVRVGSTIFGERDYSNK